MRDIDTTVTFMRDLLKHEASTRSSSTSPSLGTSSFSGNQPRDATAYKHDDSRSNSGTYKPSSRHLDRKAVRYAGEDSDADIKDIRRQLQNTSALLDSSNDDYSRKTEEDERLEQEVDDLKYRVKRLQEDIDYVSKGRRSADKDEERRKLERELLFLMHEKLPELERRQEQREEEKGMEERAGTRARDKRNQTFGRYDDREDRNGDRDWLRGSYDRDRRDRSRDRDYDRYDRDSRDRSRERRDYDRDYRDRDRSHERRPRTPPASRTPPPAPPPAAAPPAAPPKPAAAAPDTKKMTPEERTAFIRAQAQARIQDRLKALGVEPAPDATVVDKSTEERLAAEKQEAENKAKAADEEQKKREEARRARMAATSPQPKDEPAPAPPTPKSILKGSKPGPPPPPTSRAKPAPPPPRSAPSPAKPPPKVEPVEDAEEAELKRREEAMAKAKEERRKRLEQMEKEEEEEARREADASANKARGPATPSETPMTPPAPPAAPPTPSPGGYNPFRKAGGGSGPAPPASGGGFNPFFKPPAQAVAESESKPVETPAPPPPPPAPPAPPAPSAPILTTRSAGNDEWEKIEEKGGSDDSSDDDDDYATSRDHRRNLASALFGNIGGGSPTTTSRPGSAGPAKTPPAALQNIGGGDPDAGRGALLSAIQGGASLRKTATVVKGEPEGGKVIGDAAPPAHINTEPVPRESAPAPFSASPEPTAAADTSGFESDFTPRNANRGSVDWYAGLAADQHPGAGFGDTSVLEPTKEEDENEDKEEFGTPVGTPTGNGSAPEIKVEGEDDTSEFDMGKSEHEAWV